MKADLSHYILYGASGHGSVILDTLDLLDEKVLCFIDDNPSLVRFDTLAVHPAVFIAGMHQEEKRSARFIISIGNNLIRKKIAETSLVQCIFGKAIHPKAVISPKAFIGEGTVVMAGAVINAKAQIGKHVIMNTNASIDHDCTIGDFVHISPNAALCGNVTVGEGVHIGAGATIIPGVHIGAWSVIGAGAVVIRDVPENTLVVGNPGKQKHT